MLCVCCSCATLVPRFTHACHYLGGFAVSMADSDGSRDSKDDFCQPELTNLLNNEINIIFGFLDFILQIYAAVLRRIDNSNGKLQRYCLSDFTVQCICNFGTDRCGTNSLFIIY